MDNDKIPENCDEVKAAVGATEEHDKGRQRILIKRAIDLGCVVHIPDSWEVKVDE